jgi:GAF domain
MTMASPATLPQFPFASAPKPEEVLAPAPQSNDALTGTNPGAEFSAGVAQLMRTCALALQARTRACGVAVAVRSAGGVCSVIASVGSGVPPAHAHLEGGMCEEAVRRRRTVLCRDAEHDENVSRDALASGVRSAVVMPAPFGDEPTALLLLASTQQDGFADQQMPALRIFADDLAAILCGRPYASREKREIADAIQPQTAGELRDPPAIAAVPVTARTPSPLARRIARLVAVAVAGSALVLSFGAARRAKLPVNADPSARRKARVPPESAATPSSQPEGQKPSVDETAALQRAAARGDAAAQYRLAEALIAGGGRSNLTSAYVWLILAGDAGNAPAKQQAVALTKKVSEDDIAEIRVKVAEAFANGRGAPQHFVKAYTWYELAEAAGAPIATERKRRLAAIMSPDQVRDATNAAQQWTAAHVASAR